MNEFTIEDSPLGRVVIAPNVPEGFALFYTTLDFDGRLNAETVQSLTSYIHERFALEPSLTTCTQVHGRQVQRAAGEESWRECDACDALWSSEPNVALGIKVADCLPVSMIDPIHRVIANVHSGWRGTAKRITDATLDAVEQSTPFTPSVASAWLGPTIGVCCFEVGEEVVEALSAAFGDVSEFVDRARAKPHVDLAGITARRLRERGFDGRRIFDSRHCTRCDGSLFHSYRRGSNGRRNLAFVSQ